MLSEFGPEHAGTYTLVVTVDGCASEPSTLEVADSPARSAFSQTTTAEFDTNANMGLATAGDQLTLADAAVYGSGADGAFAPTADTTLAGATYQFTNVTIPAGVTVTVTGTEALVIRDGAVDRACRHALGSGWQRRFDPIDGGRVLFGRRGGLPGGRVHGGRFRGKRQFAFATRFRCGHLRLGHAYLLVDRTGGHITRRRRARQIEERTCRARWTASPLYACGRLYER